MHQHMGAIYKSEAGRHAIGEFYRAALARWPVANDQIVIPTRHGDTFVVACGPSGAPPLILLHGSGTNSAVWMRDVVEWSKQHRVYAVDLIGEPGLSAPSRPPLCSNAYVEWLDDVWDQLRLESASVVGVSLGGWLALLYSVHRPRRLMSLSLLSPAGIGARKRLFMWKVGLLLLLGKTGIRRAFKAAGGNAATAPAVAKYMTLIFENFRPRHEAPPIFTDAELRALSFPVQVIVGAKDTMLNARDTEARVRRLLPEADLTVIDDAGHMLPSQTARVANFLRRSG